MASCMQHILGEKIVNDTGTVSWNWRYPNGDAYDNTKVDTSKVISVDNFEKLEKSIYTAIGRLRNSIYKTNEYINR